MIDLSPTCPICGVPMRDVNVHQQFHDGLRELARQVEAPGMSPEEYEQALREERERRAVDAGETGTNGRPGT